MEKKYTYGYNVGWDSENNYINSINNIMEKYNNSTSEIFKIIDSFNKNTKDISNNNRITDEQIRNWYNEDYSLNNSLVSFESYKRSILDMIKGTNFKLESELSKKLDEYYANSYYLINIKGNAKKQLNKRKNELELLLLEQKNFLDIISLNLTRVKQEYDENGNLINSNEFQVLRNKYDNMWLEIRKIEYALKYLNEMFKKVELKKDEMDLLQEGLTIEQQVIYKELIFEDEKNSEKEEYNKSLDTEQLEVSKENISTNESNKSHEIREMIEYFKSIKADLTEQDIKEIEGFIKR